jgi:hypothetical protein
MTLRNQKYQRKATHMIFTLSISINTFFPNLTCMDTGTTPRSNLKKTRIKEGEEFHQEPDHPGAFMRIVRERTRTMSAVNDERHQVLPSKVIWNGC